jgi:hypothetical protein
MSASNKWMSYLFYPSPAVVEQQQQFQQRDRHAMVRVSVAPDKAGELKTRRSRSGEMA